jgi:hypothetical protein
VGVAPVLLLAMLVAVEGQSLGEAAKREQERRKAQATKPVRSFSDADLPSATVPRDTPEDAPTPETPSPSASPSKEKSPGYGLPDDETERKQLEASWRARFAAARATLQGAQSRAFEDRVEVAWKAGIPYQTMVRVPVETEELKGARRALADLEEEFRRTGLPPGWARE